MTRTRGERPAMGRSLARTDPACPARAGIGRAVVRTFTQVRPAGLASDNGGYVNPPSPPVGAVFMGSGRGLGVEPARPPYRMRAN